MNEQHYYGFTKEPFAQDVRVEDLYPAPYLAATTERILYAIKLGAVSLVTGEVGSGKSTALRYTTSKLHPSQYKVIPVIATSGSLIEMLRQICMGFGVASSNTSVVKLARLIRDVVTETAQKKQVPVLVIDEANLVRLEVFAEIHTLSQFEMDSKPLLPVVLAGQNNLLDRLMYHTSRPLASRVIGRSHLEGLKAKDMAGYLKHHLEIAGISEQLFSDEAILAIHQGSGGLLRRANYLAKGALLAAAAEKCRMVAAEHVRIASTEII
jgi:type II secretory pathway predicted ATPase ExeA